MAGSDWTSDKPKAMVERRIPRSADGSKERPIDRLRAGQPAVLIANPTAQSGRAEPMIRHVRALLDAARVPHRFISSEPDGRTIEIVRRAIDDDGARVVVYMGGDGTFAEVAKGLLASKHSRTAAMGMLPMGTANDQGKSFGLKVGPRALGRNVRVISEGNVLAVDVGAVTVERGGLEVRKDRFFDSLTVGISGGMLEARNRDRARVSEMPIIRTLYRDQAVYAGAILKRFLRSYVHNVKFDLDAVIDGRIHQFSSIFDVIIKNTEIFGGEWIFDQDSLSDDGRFEFIPVMGRRDFSSKMFAGFRHSPLNLDDLRKLGFEIGNTIRGSSFQLTIPGEPKDRPDAQIDGEELVSGDRYRIEVEQRHLRLLMPTDVNEI